MPPRASVVPSKPPPSEPLAQSPTGLFAKPLRGSLKQREQVINRLILAKQFGVYVPGKEGRELEQRIRAAARRKPDPYPDSAPGPLEPYFAEMFV